MADLPNFPTPAPESISKEREVGIGASAQIEKAPVVEVGKIPETLAEKEGYVERIEKEVELQKPILGDNGQVLVTSPTAQPPKIVLPVSSDTFLSPSNWKLPVSVALRWLLEWSKKIAKMYPGRTVFRN